MRVCVCGCVKHERDSFRVFTRIIRRTGVSVNRMISKNVAWTRGRAPRLIYRQARVASLLEIIGDAVSLDEGESVIWSKSGAEKIINYECRSGARMEELLRLANRSATGGGGIGGRWIADK